MASLIGAPRSHGHPVEPRRSRTAHPKRVAEALRDAIPQTSHVWVEIGGSMLWLTPTLKRLYANFDLSLASGSMGIALPGAIGCCIAGTLADAQQHVVAVIGDAAFKMGGMELHTALEENLNLITVIWNDQGHGLVDSGSHQVFHSPLGQYRFKHRINCAGIAQAMGIPASAASSPGQLRALLTAALGRQGPTLIDVWIDERVPLPLGARGEALSFHNDQAAVDP